jgi:hypothetical protein
MIGTGSPPPLGKPFDCTSSVGREQDHWDPKPDERILYRDTQTGDLGYLVRRGGKDRVRLDRPNEEIIRPLDDHWAEENEYRPFNLFQVAAIAFESDKLLARMMGNHPEAKREWMSMREEKRIDFMQNGPSGNALRSELWTAIMGVLKPHAR